MSEQRGTGKTTTQINLCIERCLAGEKVLFMVHNRVAIRRISFQINEMDHPNLKGITRGEYQCTDSSGTLTISTPDSWKQLCGRRLDHYDIDHHARKFVTLAEDDFLKTLLTPKEPMYKACVTGQLIYEKFRSGPCCMSWDEITAKDRAKWINIGWDVLNSLGL